jgi:hypothetical protein
MTGLLLERVDPAEFADVLKSLADFADNKTAIADLQNSARARRPAHKKTCSHDFPADPGSFLSMTFS